MPYRLAEATFKRERAILFRLRTTVLHAHMQLCAATCYLLRCEVVRICRELVRFMIVVTSILTRYLVPLDLTSVCSLLLVTCICICK